MSDDWLNGIGLVCSIAGVLAIYRFGEPFYRPIEDARKSYLVLEKDDPGAGARAKHAAVRSNIGLVLPGAGFALLFAALFA